MPKKNRTPYTLELPIMEEFGRLSEDGQKFISAILSIEERQKWHGHDAVPPSSLLDEVLRSFERNTDIPLEIPFSAVITYLSGFLCAQGTKVRISGTQVISPKTWIVTLADSGAGKTFATSKVGKILGEGVPKLENTSSGVALIQAIQKTPRGIWIRDEFGQYLRSLQTQTHMEKAKDILLSAYNEETLEHITKSDSIVVEDPAFSILGITVNETFLDQVGSESLVDGFAQRFNYLYAERDEKRKITDFPIYFNERRMTDSDKKRESRLVKKAAKIFQRDDLNGAIFTVGGDAFDAFEAAFRDNFNGDIPESFYRRALFSMFSYACVYHLLLEKKGTEIGDDAMSYASRAIVIHLRDIKKLLVKSGWSELETLVQKCEDWKERFEKSKNRKATFRDLIAGVRDIKTTTQAKHMFLIISRRDKNVN